jgi:hypothetical protein
VRYFALFVALLFASSAGSHPHAPGSTTLPVQRNPSACTVAEVQAATCSPLFAGLRIVVTDAASAIECGNPGDAGGGAISNACYYSASRGFWTPEVQTAPASERFVKFHWSLASLSLTVGTHTTEAVDQWGSGTFRNDTDGAYAPPGYDIQFTDFIVTADESLTTNSERCKYVFRAGCSAGEVSVSVGKNINLPTPNDGKPYRWYASSTDEDIDSSGESNGYFLTAADIAAGVGLTSWRDACNWSVTAAKTAEGYTCSRFDSGQMTTRGYLVPRP